MKGLARVAVVSCLFVNAAWADGDESKPPMYGAAMGSYLLPDNVRNDTNGFGAHLVFGLPLTQSLNLEINGFGTALTQGSSTKTVVVGGKPTLVSSGETDAQFGLGADLMYGFGHHKLMPFVLGGAGVEFETFYDTRKQDQPGPFVDLGAGVLYKFTPHFSLRAEARYYGIYNNGSYDPRGLGDARFNIGLQYGFFKSPPPPPPCNCSAPPPPPPPPVVSKRSCPAAPPGFKIDENGCIVEQAVVLRGINFVFNKDLLTPAARDTLDQVVVSLKAQPELYVQVEGHTDSIGSDAYNNRLSTQRAESVRSYLISKGVNPEHLNAKGFGKTRPIATNSTPEGRAENRRVVFVVINTPPSLKVIEKAPTEASKADAEHGEPARLSGDEAAPAKPKAKHKKAAPKPAAAP